MNMPMLRWVDLTEVGETEIQTYLDLPCDGIVLTPKQYHMIDAENKLHSECAVSIEAKAEIEGIKSGIIILSSDVAVLDAAREMEHRTGLFVSIKNAQDLLCAANLGPLYDYVYVQFYDETNIPLELLIATFQKYPSLRLFKYVYSSQEAEVVRSVMETGCSGVVIKSSDINTVNQYLDGTNSMDTEHIELVEAEITGIYHIGAGERACVDTTSLLKPNEGLLVGSTAKGGILVSSETHFLPYMNLRPFRVNAGAIHSYVWNHETTSYLSELKSGDSI